MRCFPIPVVVALFLAPLFLPCVVAETNVSDLAELGPNCSARMEKGVAITEGVVRVRRRHENDMDFAKYNPFYWEGRLTRFKVADYTPLGQNKIVFSLFTEWPQDYTKYRGPDFSAIYHGDPLANETLRSKFAINVRMKHHADHAEGERRHFEATIEGGAFNVWKDELKPGALLTFEYRFFNDEAHPGWANQKKRNAHNLSAYYSEFFRIEIGKPGLLIDAGMEPASADQNEVAGTSEKVSTGKMDPADYAQLNRYPDAARYTGGWTTTPSMRVEPWSALQQQAFNLTPANAQAFLTGRSWFHTDLNTGEHRSDPSDDKPSVFFEEMESARSGYAANMHVASSCNQCHAQNGRSSLPEIGELPVTTVAKTHARTGGPHPYWGKQFQNGEDGRWALSGFETRSVTFDDGTTVELSQPTFNTSWPDEEDVEVGLSIRSTPALIGAGLLDAVPDPAIRINAAASELGGKVRLIDPSQPYGSIGRFGWKASQPTLQAQIRDALVNDMGVRSLGQEDLDVVDSGTLAKLVEGKDLLPEPAVEALEAYVALLGVPPRDNPHDPAVRRGAVLFDMVGCAQCHLPTLKTGASSFPELAHQTIHPYTDLLLHDLGDGLADDSNADDARLWRTAPLWGLKNMRAAKSAHRDLFRPGDTNVTYVDTHARAKTNAVELLHDGRARSIAEAILWHGGSAKPSVDRYKALSKSERADLEAFLWDL